MVDLKTIPRTLGFASSSSRVLKRAVQTAVFMLFTGSRWRETIARASLRAYETERTSAVIMEDFLTLGMDRADYFIGAEDM